MKPDLICTTEFTLERRKRKNFRTKVPYQYRLCDPHWQWNPLTLVCDLSMLCEW